MKKNRIRKALVVVAVSIGAIFCIGYAGLKVLQHQLEKKITGCTIESNAFIAVIPFEYINSWIVVQVRVAGSEKEFPFILDTGAQTVLLDSLLNEIGTDNFSRLAFSNESDSVEHAFNNELLSLSQLGLGEVSFRDIGAISAKNSKWEMLNCISPYGIIGYNILQTFYSQIDYTKKQLIITDDIKRLPNYDQIQWLDYTPIKNQESPMVQAMVNDSIKVSLLLDTGFSGGIALKSDKLFNSFTTRYPNRTLKYISKPTLKIRGENDETYESVFYKPESFSLGSFSSDGIIITLENGKEREFTGSVGNKYLENFIITLDYKSNRIGFIQQHNPTSDNSTYGVNYIASKKGIAISSVIHGSAAHNLGIQSGDVLHSINGIKTSELDENDFCSIYRAEYEFNNPQDSTLTLEILKGEKVVKYELKKYNKF